MFRRLRRALIIALAEMLLITGVVLAVAYINEAPFTYEVTLETGTPGMVISPSTLVFENIAIGYWSKPIPVTVTNTSPEPYSNLYLESVNPVVGLDLYIGYPYPELPLISGASTTFPMVLKADSMLTPGKYGPISSKVVGQR